METENQDKESGTKALGCVTLILMFIAICGFLMMFGGCSEPRIGTYTVAIKSCLTEKWDTVQLTIKGGLWIHTEHQAVPILQDDNYSKIRYNVCEFKIIK